MELSSTQLDINSAIDGLADVMTPPVMDGIAAIRNATHHIDVYTCQNGSVPLADVLTVWNKHNLGEAKSWNVTSKELAGHVKRAKRVVKWVMDCVASSEEKELIQGKEPDNQLAEVR